MNHLIIMQYYCIIILNNSFLFSTTYFIHCFKIAYCVVEFYITEIQYFLLLKFIHFFYHYYNHRILPLKKVIAYKVSKIQVCN